MSPSPLDSHCATLRVAVGVIVNPVGEVLIARRAEHVHQGGLWEFPGGKCEAGEPVEQALSRELKEELDINVLQAEPWLRIHHHYPDQSVLLEVWRVKRFAGEPRGVQGQPLRWEKPEQLVNYQFPQANRAIITGLRMPRQMLITGQWGDVNEFTHRLQRALHQGIRLVQLRAHEIPVDQFQTLAALAKAYCDDHGAQLIVNTSLEAFQQLPAAGVHLSARRLMALPPHRPIDSKYLLGASCHNQKEIAHAERIGADYITLSPVFLSHSHPDTEPLGVETFLRWSGHTHLPVFALGGVDDERSQTLESTGAYGIAAIGLWW